MSLREDMWKYEHITGESAEHVPIIKLGAFLDGYEMGLKALEQQPCEDCISRAEALKHSHIEYDDDGEGHRVIYVEDIENLSSVTPSYNSIKTELDCVSRQAVIQIIENKLNPCTDMFKCLEMSEIKEDVEHLPPVTPQQTRWIPVSEKLPDECINCLITVKTDAYFCNPHYENYIAWFDGKDFVYEYKNKSIVAKISIIAWQPLPQPYKAESEGE